MKTNFMTLVAAGILLFSSLQSCRHESLETEISDVSRNPVSAIRGEYMKGKNGVAGKQIEWGKARLYKNGDKVILVTVPVKSSGGNIIEELTFRIDNNKVSGHLWKFESDTVFKPDDYLLTAHEIMAKMTGTVSYVALEGSLRYEKKLIRGKFVDEISRNGTGPIDAPGCIICHGEIKEIIIHVPGGGPAPPPPDNPTIPIPPIVIPPPNNPGTDPCSKIKGQKGTAAYNQKINDLKSKTGLQKETGYSQKANGAFAYHDHATTNPDTNSLSLPKLELPENKDITGYMHTHVDDFSLVANDGTVETRKGIKMFSPADVGYFMDMLSNAQSAGRSLADIYAVMVTSTGIYQIRFLGSPAQIKTFTKQQLDALKITYRDAMIKAKNLEFSFLKFLKDKMGIEGVNLYRIQQIGKTTEIKLGSDGKTQQEDCPQ